MKPATVLAAVSLLLLGACTGSGNYYRSKCSNQGYSAGTRAHSTCMQQEKAWIEWTDYRAKTDGFGR